MFQCISIIKLEHSGIWPILYALEFIEDGEHTEEQAITLNDLVYTIDLVQEDLTSITGITVSRKLGREIL